MLFLYSLEILILQRYSRGNVVSQFPYSMVLPLLNKYIYIYIYIYIYYIYIIYTYKIY